MPSYKSTSRKIVINVPNVYSLFSLIFRDHTNKTYNKLREEVKRKGVCPICRESLGKHKVQAIHKRGFSREEIVKRIIGAKKEVDFEYVVNEYEQLHRKRAIIAIGCQECHKAYSARFANCKKVIPDKFFIKTDFRKGVSREAQLSPLT